jgi:hypothetical protein
MASKIKFGLAVQEKAAKKTLSDHRTSSTLLMLAPLPFF